MTSSVDPHAGDHSEGIHLPKPSVTPLIFGLGFALVAFGIIFTVLIALEFNHSIIGVLHRKESIVQVRTVVLIALLALVRKFIILDASKTDPLTILGLAAAILALGSVHWFVRDQDRKDAAEQDQARGTAD